MIQVRSFELTFSFLCAILCGQFKKNKTKYAVRATKREQLVMTSIFVKAFILEYVDKVFLITYNNNKNSRPPVMKEVKNYYFLFIVVIILCL